MKTKKFKLSEVKLKEMQEVGLKGWSAVIENNTIYFYK